MAVSNAKPKLKPERLKFLMFADVACILVSEPLWKLLKI